MLRLLELPAHRGELVARRLVRRARVVGGPAAAYGPARLRRGERGLLRRQLAFARLRLLRLARRRLRLARRRVDVALGVGQVPLPPLHLARHLVEALAGDAQLVRRVHGGDGGDAARLLHLVRLGGGALRSLERVGYAPKLAVLVPVLAHQVPRVVLRRREARARLLHRALGGFALLLQAGGPVRSVLGVLHSAAQIILRPVVETAALALRRRLLHLVPEHALAAGRDVVRLGRRALAHTHLLHGVRRGVRGVARRRQARALRLEGGARRLVARRGEARALVPVLLQRALALGEVARERVRALFRVAHASLAVVRAPVRVARGVARGAAQTVSLVAQSVAFRLLGVARLEALLLVPLERARHLAVATLVRAVDLARDGVQVAPNAPQVGLAASGGGVRGEHLLVRLLRRRRRRARRLGGFASEIG